MDIGFKIKQLRESRGLTQEELTDQLGVSQGQISKIESGQKEKIDFLFMQKVCDFFDVDFGYFTQSLVQNNHVKYNKGGVVGNMHGNIYNEKKDKKNESNN